MKKLFSLVSILCFAIFGFTTMSHAWDGFDQETNDHIEITSGNLVREGLVIEFYVNDELHMGRVVSLIEIAGGTELVIEDVNEEDDERTIIME